MFKINSHMFPPFCGTVWCSQFSYSLRAGRSGDQIPLRASISTPVQTGPGGSPNLLYNGFRVFIGGKAAGALRWRPTPSSVEVKERVELYFYPSLCLHCTDGVSEFRSVSCQSHVQAIPPQKCAKGGKRRETTHFYSSWACRTLRLIKVSRF